MKQKNEKLQMKDGDCRKEGRTQANSQNDRNNKTEKN